MEKWHVVITRSIDWHNDIWVDLHTHGTAYLKTVSSLAGSQIRVTLPSWGLISLGLDVSSLWCFFGFSVETLCALGSLYGDFKIRMCKKKTCSRHLLLLRAIHVNGMLDKCLHRWNPRTKGEHFKFAVIFTLACLWTPSWSLIFSFFCCSLNRNFWNKIVL